MEYKNKVLEYSENVVLSIRKQYNLDKQEDLEQIINIIEDWIEKQPHFKKKKFAKKYLENTIITSKGSIARAKRNIEKICTVKTLYSNLFNIYDVRNISDECNGFINHSLLPKLTNQNYRVYVANILKPGIKSQMISNMYRYAIMLIEYTRITDCNEGIVAINDLRNIKLRDVLSEVNMVELRQIITVLTEGYALRLKGVHFITTSSAVDILLTMLKSVVSGKIQNRIHAHKSLDTLYEIVPKDILPVEYGGNEASLQDLNDKWNAELSRKETLEYLKDIFSAGTDEELRQKSAYDEPYMGLTGTFRTLSVD